MAGSDDRRVRCPGKRGKPCGRQFTPRRGTTRKFCYVCSPEASPVGPASMSGPAPVVALPDVLAPPPVDGEVTKAVRAELERCSAAGTLAGALALRLARSLDDPRLAAGQVSSITAQLERTMAPLAPRAPREPDAADEIAARAAAKAASA